MARSTTGQSRSAKQADVMPLKLVKSVSCVLNYALLFRKLSRVLTRVCLDGRKAPDLTFRAPTSPLLGR